MITKFKVCNFLSLRNVEFELDKLNVLVGKSGAGKSNIINSLIMIGGLTSNIVELDSVLEIVQEKNQIFFGVWTDIDDVKAKYAIAINDGKVWETVATEDNEHCLLMNEAGEGFVRGIDEERMKINTDNPRKTVLMECHQYGNKPIIKNIAEFIDGCVEYQYADEMADSLSKAVFELKNNHHDDYETFKNFVFYLTKGNLDIFADSIVFIERDGKRVGLRSLSDGHIKLLSAKLHTLDCYEKSHKMIVFRHPEAGLDYDNQKMMADLLWQVSQHTQLVVETHSPAMVDEFDTYKDDVNVLYLEKDDDAVGTEIRTLDDLQKRHAGFDGWRVDFGLGSALFDSGLTQK